VKGWRRPLHRRIRQKNYPHSLVLDTGQQPGGASGCQCTHQGFANDHQHADSPLQNLRHPTAFKCCFCCNAVVGNDSFSEMYVFAISVVQCYSAHCVMEVATLWSQQRRSYTYAYMIYIYIYTYIHIPTVYVKSSPVTDLEWPRRFQEVKVPRLRDNGTGWW
jgi:hypothetical protein